MNLYNYKYVNVPELTGDIITDINKLLLLNSKNKTLEHVRAVADTNRIIGERFGLNEDTCIISAYLHDISTIITPKDMLKYMMDHSLFIDEAEMKYPFLLHQRISKLIVEKHFNIVDEDILSAIECHTTLKSKPSKYDMALFISDKLSWDQGGRPPFYEVIAEGLSHSFEKACLEYMNYIMDNHMILFPHSWLIEGKKYMEAVLGVKDI